ncbi:MAG: hypothetical protein AEth_01421 [Candidatus Argoarchaeum ethanivorans]|uniref:Uncharacterized protein n=1 Tax=Candidatus Argoarchaeum ethanivorans TaxID=2608793 RepID=A0A8B3S2D7_9EURY|nr:MAG: hypothetical protein AEth_01421 [Candidatus Argoarchaeum ethanivorans]
MSTLVPVPTGLHLHAVYRNVVFYYFVKDETRFVPTSITLIRISMESLSNDTDEYAIELCKKLAGDTFPLMFEPGPPQKTLCEMIIAKNGAVGYLMITAMFLTPIGILPLSFADIRRKLWQLIR